MSEESKVETVRIGPVEKHPNADALSITKIHGGYPVVFRTGTYKEADLATYIPVDSIVPDNAGWDFLRGHRRIRAMRLRGVFSMGMLAAHVASTVEGDDVQDHWGIVKWMPPVERYGKLTAEGAPPPACALGLVGKYEVEGFRKHGRLLVEGEDVVITEKIHGVGFRAVHDGERLHVGSRGRWLKDMPDSAGQLWWDAARYYRLEEILKDVPKTVLFGELYGRVGRIEIDLKYGVPFGTRLAFFDAWNQQLDWISNDSMLLVFGKELPFVPTLYEGPWKQDLVALAEGTSTVPGADHVREGFVVRPVRPRFEERLQGQLVLKMAGEGYLTRLRDI